MAQPTCITCLSDCDSPVSLFNKLKSLSPVSCLLESTDGDTRLARYSVIGIDPIRVVSFKDGQTTMRFPQENREESTVCENPLSVLSGVMDGLKSHFSGELPRTDFPFCGGWVGYMGYGATRYFDQIPQQAADPLDVPDGMYALYDSVILFDHLLRQMTFLSYRPQEEALALWKTIQSHRQTAKGLAPLYPPQQEVDDDRIFDGVIQPMSQAVYEDKVREAKALIQAGEVFQIVVAHRFSRPLTAKPIDIYRTLQSINPSPYAYFLQFDDLVYLGSSPETFVRCHQGEVVLRALAGTRHRGATDAEDQALAAELRANEKELAEHRMLIDLGRNDLGRVCETGSIVVGEIAQVTRYTHVMHLATEIRGQLKPDKTAYQVFQSCFPRGTVSGAPKIRAMHLLSQLEPERRGVYSGVVGYFDHQGNMDGAIAIRSALIKNSVAHVHAGAGVVYDSTPMGEYQETRNKAKSMLKALAVAERLTENFVAEKSDEKVLR